MHSIAVHGNPFHYFFKYIIGIRKAVCSINPDIISVCDDGLKGFFVPLFASNKHAYIYERHASIFINAHQNKTFFGALRFKTTHFLMTFLARQFDALVVLTKSNVSEWHSKNCTIISNPLPFYSSASSHLNNQKIIVVGSHSFNKGYDLLLLAWHQIAHNYAHYTLEIFGKLDRVGTFITLANQLNVSNVIFKEPVLDIQTEMLQADFLVLPSRSEGFGMVLIEAMACGLPVIAFDCPSGPRDIITQHVDGILVPPENVNKLAAAIESLLIDSNLKNKMGGNAKKKAKNYNPDLIMSQWELLFNNLKK